MQHQKPDLGAPSLELIFRAHVKVGAMLDLGKADGLNKRIFPILGGTFAGPNLNGIVLPGGADWQTVDADGTARVFARYTLKLDDGTLIAVTNPGIRRGPADILQRIVAGEDVDPSLYYFRTTPSFEVAAGPHRWLSESVFVGNAARYREMVIIDFMRVR